MFRYLRLDLILSFTLLGTLSLVLTGCGNNLIGDKTLNEEELMAGYPTEVEVVDSYENYTCAADYNIKPANDISGQGFKDFKGCASTSSAWKALAVAKDSNLKRVCVYPAQYIDQSHLYLKPDLTQPGKYLSACVDLGSAGKNAASVEFTNVNYNYFYIVDEDKKSQMEACLTNMNLGACEGIISKGKFR